ncbi:TonB-dependent receptor [Pedobacter sp. L105]|uniref:SusC/RagA family TonB-linked outer membrane protein n=1 Tax=Pedobacter sp. L105 TaxID=1641871 RepID=UPI00131E5657|nr:TonB-dependent receptor [Pedobacter sp. L105]
MQKIYKTKRFYVWFVPIVTLLLSFNTSAQVQTKPLINSTLNGQVLDAKTQEPIIGANITIKGTTHEVATNSDGRFSFVTGQKFPYTLIIRSVTYKTQELIATGGALIIRLEENVSQLNDVVVVGYGTQRKSDVTGSLSSVPKENLNQATSSVDNLLRGSAPGVQVTQSSGSPGASASIRIRGGNSITGGNEPLYVIDGFPVYNDNASTTTGVGSGASVNALSSINPSDIESIEILKDASATAIYGSRGANGVVIVTTKKGKRGTNNVTYSAYYGLQKITKELDLLNGSQWAQLHDDIQVASGVAPSYTAAQIAAFGAGTDWQAAAFRTAPVQNHELSISGGDDKSRYAISGNYFDQDGILLNTNYKRYSTRFNYDHDVSEKFKVGVNLSSSYSTSLSAASNTGGNTLTSPNVITNIISTAPVIALRNADGSYNTINPYSTTVSNPIQDLEIVKNQTLITRTLGNFYGEYKIIPGLTAKVSFGADLLNTKQNYYAPSNSANGYTSLGYAAVGNKTVNTWLNENTITYDKSFNDKHFFNVLVGYSTQFSKEESATSGSKNFVTDLTSYNSLQSGSQTITPTSDAYTWALNSYLARINYSYEHKYNVTVSARADGSSRFGSGNKWGYFPSTGFSWNAGQEDFLKDVKAISNLKLRLSAGITGNQEIGQYQSLSTLSPFTYDFNGTLVTGFAATRLANEALKWEKTDQYDSGLDLGLLDNRINLSFDAYYKKTNNLLLSVPIPLSTGFATSLQNIGSLSNKGLELGITTDNIKGSKFTWKSSLVYSLNRNKVLSLGSLSSYFPTVSNGTLSVLQPVNVVVGQPLGTFWGYKTDGIFQTAAEIASSATLDSKANTKVGDQRYVDTNGDGVINSKDKVSLGTAQPKFTGSFTNTFGYNNFDLVVFLQGSYGGKIYNALKQQLDITNLSQNSTTAVLDSYSASNPSNVTPRASSSPVAQMSSRYIENGSYLRLKSLTLGYTFNQSSISKIHAKQLRVYIAAQNLFTWTKYTGYDPEVSSFEQSNVLQGIDYGAYPNYKTFLAGLSLTF